MRENKKIEGLKHFGHEIKLAAFADDVTYFIANQTSLEELFYLMKSFQKVSSLKVSMEKLFLCGIGSLKGVQGAFCGCNLLDLTLNSLKIPGVHFSYLVATRNYVEAIKSIQNTPSIWNVRDLSLAGRIQVFKVLGISKIIYLSYVNNVPISIIEELKNIHIDFIWQKKKPKIKHTTLIADYCDGGYKDVDIESKIESLKLSWVKRLCDNNFHAWKIIPLALLDSCGGLAVSHSNLSAESLSYSKTMPNFYVNLVISWESFSRKFPEPNEAESYNIFSVSLCGIIQT